MYYGQANDEYGWPYVNGADVILRSGTNEIARHAIDGSISPGVNFALYISLDDGSSAMPYSDIALVSGDDITIVVRDERGEQMIMQTNALPAVGVAGEVILVNVTAGVDADADGMSDAWEQELIDYANDPAMTTIEDVLAGDDYDGDGASNWQEYMSGNFAFLDYDYFFIEHATQLPERWQLEMLSVPGKAYSVSYTTNLTSGVWQECEFSPTESGVPSTGPIEGHGDWLSFYVSYTNSFQFFRLNVR